MKKILTRAALCAAFMFISRGTLGAQAPEQTPAGRSPIERREMGWLLAPVDSGQARPHAVVYSDLYYTRLTIHRIASYAMLPLFAGEYYLGNKLLNDANAGVRSSHTMRSEHSTIAAGLGVLFTLNTATGLWNLWDSRHDSNGKTRKYVHSALLLASDAMMVWAGASAGHERAAGSTAAQHHRNIALGAIGLSTIGTVMMWLWN